MHAGWQAELIPDWLSLEEQEHSHLLPHLHSHWSAALLEEHSPPSDTVHALIQHAAFPLAIAPDHLLKPLAQQAGMVMAGKLLRRGIDRTSRARVQQALGDDALQWAATQAPSLHPGLTTLTDLTIEGMDLPESMQFIGLQLLLHSMQTAPDYLRTRTQWRFPATWATFPALAVEWPSPPQALDICQGLMNSLDSTWLSCLPKTH